MEQLLATMLYIPPTRLKLVSRPRLVARINESLHRILTLISAPAGFGKTTLISEWVEQVHIGSSLENSVVWPSLDESDNDPIRFLAYTITALRQLKRGDDNLGKGAHCILQSSQQPPTETILTSLINEFVAISGKIILVLDDYHLIAESAIDTALALLLVHLHSQ